MDLYLIVVYRSVGLHSIKRYTTIKLTYTARLNTIDWSGTQQNRDTPMTLIIGRAKEKALLETIYTSPKAEFLAVHGRRRVGKTFLIREFFKKKKNFIFFCATGMKDGLMPEQLANFINAVGDAFLYQGIRLEIPKNWHDAFQAVTNNIQTLPKDKKIVIFFDEFPWMATKNSRLLQTLEYFWNHHWGQDNRIKLIVCGSSSSWILKNIVNNKGGLYNRITRNIHLKPFSLSDTKKLLTHLKVKLKETQIIQLYSVLGGIPFYLSKIDPGLSATQIIETLAFDKGSFLLKEFDNLYATLFGSEGAHIELACAIAQHRHGIGKENLLKQLNLPSGGTTTTWLEELEQADFIIRFQPYQHQRRGTYYKMIDEYSLFYFQWIEPMKNSLLIRGTRKGYWEKLQASPAWKSWSGYAFELICYKHITQISQALHLNPLAIPYTWRYVPPAHSTEDGAEIDLLFDRDDDAITLCEIKNTLAPFSINKAYAKVLLNKKNIFVKRTRTKKQIFFAMISANGLADNLYADELIDTAIDSSALFKDEE